MSVPFVTCPSCNSMLLSDTIQCPQCRHVLQPDRLPSTADDLDGARLLSEITEHPCPSCQEMVRDGLVRCWNCGSFMRKEIAESYQRMRRSPQPVIYSQAAEDGSGTVAAAPLAESGDDDEFVAEDEDFELDADIAEAWDQANQPQSPQGAVTAGSATTGTAASTSADSVGSIPLSAASATDPSTEPATDGGETATEQASSGTTTESEAKSTESKPDDDEADEAHSVATGGDALLQIAIEEEAESKARKRRGGRRSLKVDKDAVIIFCPNGHRIVVQDRHRGLTGKCPKCRAPFYVPEKKPKPSEDDAAQSTEAATDSAETTSATPDGYGQWMCDVHLHTVNPEKLKLKVGSLAKDFQEVDVGFSSDGMLVVHVYRPGGLVIGSPEKKKVAAREKMLEHFKAEGTIDNLPVAQKWLFPTESMDKLSVAQPFPYDFESMFAGVLVFGEGRIAVRLPKIEQTAQPQFLSFWLSKFRDLAARLQQYYSIESFGANVGIPATDSYLENECHYSEQKFEALNLDGLEYYIADPKIELEIVGRKCQGCGLVISEEARKKERIGGKAGKTIAKAVCPKCKEKFGDVTLYIVAGRTAEPEESVESETPVESNEK